MKQDVAATRIESQTGAPGAAAPRATASAPGRLDVMGGIVEYTGGMVLQMPLASRVSVAICLTDDGMAAVRREDSPAGAVSIAVDHLIGSNGAAPDGRRIRMRLGDDAPDTAIAAIGVVAELFHAGVAAPLRRGVLVELRCGLDAITDAGRTGATCAAVAAALLRLLGIQKPPVWVAALCQRVENEYLDWPGGQADAMCALTGRQDALIQMECRPDAPCQFITLPGQVTMYGVDVGLVHPTVTEKYRQARTTAFMGLYLIRKIVAHEPHAYPKFDGFLSSISNADFVERFRSRLPKKLSGRDFLDRFDGWDDPLTSVDPDFIYKVQSRTEHHVYENDRTKQFVGCLQNAGNPKMAESALVEAGDLMRASHWSYGQRCGLGSVETDLMVNLLRQAGTAAGIFGARASGRGCGGVVVVLARNDEPARAAIQNAVEIFNQRTRRSAHVLAKSSAGALHDSGSGV